MSIETQPVALPRLHPADVPEDELLRLTVPQYHQMIRTGVLTDDDPVELLEGWLVIKMAKNPEHRLATRLVRESLESVVPPGWFVEVQEPVTLPTSEPEPDVSLIRGEPREYRERHPGPEDLALVVEVADTTLERDRTLKKRLYAAAEVPVYWIVNLRDRRLEVYTDPTGPVDQPGYRVEQSLEMGKFVGPIVEGQEVARVAVAELLP